MKRGSTLFLRGAVIAIGAVVLALCVFALPAIWRAVPGEYSGITYVFYIILLALYASAVPFYIALHQTLQLLNYVDKNKAFSELSVKALKRITYCAGTISLLYMAILPFIYIWAEKDDAPGLIVIGMAFTFASLTVGVFAAVLQRLLKDAIDIKSENDLTV
jgi:hypothetical protein